MPGKHSRTFGLTSANETPDPGQLTEPMLCSAKRQMCLYADDTQLYVSTI